MIVLLFEDALEQSFQPHCMSSVELASVEDLPSESRASPCFLARM